LKLYQPLLNMSNQAFRNSMSFWDAGAIIR